MPEVCKILSGIEWFDSKPISGVDAEVFQRLAFHLFAGEILPVLNGFLRKVCHSGGSFIHELGGYSNDATKRREYNRLGICMGGRASFFEQLLVAAIGTAPVILSAAHKCLKLNLMLLTIILICI